MGVPDFLIRGMDEHLHSRLKALARADARSMTWHVLRALEVYLGDEQPLSPSPAPAKRPDSKRSEAVPPEEKPPVSKPKIVPKVSSVGDAKALLAEAEKQAGVGCPCTKAMEKNTGYGVWCDRDKGGCGRRKR